MGECVSANRIPEGRERERARASVTKSSREDGLYTAASRYHVGTLRFRLTSGEPRAARGTPYRHPSAEREGDRALSEKRRARRVHTHIQPTHDSCRSPLHSTALRMLSRSIKSSIRTDREIEDSALHHLWGFNRA